MHGTRLQIALFDNQQVFLDALEEKINAQPDMQVALKATSPDVALKEVLEKRLNVVILDVDLGGRGSFATVREINIHCRDTQILFLTGYLSTVLVEHAVQLKAAGYILKSESMQFLLSGIRRIASGELCFSSEVERQLEFDVQRRFCGPHFDDGISQLSARQLEVLRHLARGESVKEVARILHLSQKSVDSHKYRIMHKLGIHDRVQLARFAIREGLLLP